MLILDHARPPSEKGGMRNPSTSPLQELVFRRSPKDFEKPTNGIPQAGGDIHSPC